MHLNSTALHPLLRLAALCIAIIGFHAQAQACACCLVGPTFGVTQGLNKAEHDIHLSNLRQSELPTMTLFRQLGEDASQGNHAIKHAVELRAAFKRETVAANAAPSWLVTLTNPDKAGKPRPLVLRFTAAAPKNWTMVALSELPTAPSLGRPQQLDYTFALPGKLAVVSDTTKVFKTPPRMDGHLLLRGKGAYCDAQLESAAFSWTAYQNPTGARSADDVYFAGEGLYP